MYRNKAATASAATAAPVLVEYKAIADVFHLATQNEFAEILERSKTESILNDLSDQEQRAGRKRTRGTTTGKRKRTDNAADTTSSGGGTVLAKEQVVVDQAKASSPPSKKRAIKQEQDLDTVVAAPANKKKKRVSSKAKGASGSSASTSTAAASATPSFELLSEAEQAMSVRRARVKQLRVQTLKQTCNMYDTREGPESLKHMRSSHAAKRNETTVAASSASSTSLVSDSKRSPAQKLGALSQTPGDVYKLCETGLKNAGLYVGDVVMTEEEVAAEGTEMLPLHGLKQEDEAYVRAHVCEVGATEPDKKNDTMLQTHKLLALRAKSELGKGGGGTKNKNIKKKGSTATTTKTSLASSSSGSGADYEMVIHDKLAREEFRELHRDNVMQLEELLKLLNYESQEIADILRSVSESGGQYMELRTASFLKLLPDTHESREQVFRSYTDLQRLLQGMDTRMRVVVENQTLLMRTLEDLYTQYDYLQQCYWEQSRVNNEMIPRQARQEVLYGIHERQYYYYNKRGERQPYYPNSGSQSLREQAERRSSLLVPLPINPYRRESKVKRGKRSKAGGAGDAAKKTTVSAAAAAKRDKQSVAAKASGYIPFEKPQQQKQIATSSSSSKRASNKDQEEQNTTNVFDVVIPPSRPLLAPVAAATTTTSSSTTESVSPSPPPVVPEPSLASTTTTPKSSVHFNLLKNQTIPIPRIVKKAVGAPAAATLTTKSTLNLNKTLPTTKTYVPEYDDDEDDDDDDGFEEEDIVDSDEGDDDDNDSDSSSSDGDNQDDVAFRALMDRTDL